MNRRIALGALWLAVLITACVGPAPSPSPTPSGGPSPTPAPSGSTTPIPTPAPSGGAFTVTSEAQAVALVLATDARFAGLGPQQHDIIGQCCWYEVAGAAGGWAVSVTVGSGDCQAGCIERETWRFRVDPAGGVELLEHEGTADAPPPGGVGPATVTILVVAGPTCPVETNPPDPNCAPRPVVGAEIIVRAPDGAELSRGATDAQGQLTITAEPGAYWLDPQPVEGLMGTATGVAFRLAAGDQATYTLAYDTGIR